MAKVMEMDEFTGDKDLSGHRIWLLDNGNKIHFVRHDPYGFWTINYDKGTVPVRLTGQYTSFPEAEKHATAYLRDIDRTVTEKLDNSIQPNPVTTQSKNKKYQDNLPVR